MVGETLDSELASDPRVNDPRPGRGRNEAVMIVDPDDAGLHGRCHAMGTCHVAGPDRGCEPKWRIVCKPQRVRLVGKAGHRGERSEHLLLEDSHVACYIAKHGRPDEVAVLMARDFCTLAAGQKTRAILVAETAV